MVVAASVASVAVAKGGTAAAAGAAIGTAAGASAATAGTGAALGTAVGVSTSGGAIAGTAVTGTAAGSALGIVGGTTAAAGSFGLGTALGQVFGGLVSANPVGLIVLGAAENKCQLTFDCWKPVLHDSSPEPSNGMLIRDIVRHPNIASVVMETTNSDTFPHIILENVWREKFEIQYFVIKDTGRLVAHANPVA